MKLRTYGNNNNNCYEFRNYVYKTSGIKIKGTDTTPYLTCFGGKLDTVCPPELEIPDKFKEYRDAYNADGCRTRRNT